MTIQYQLSNGKFVNFNGDVARILQDAVKFDAKWIAGSDKKLGLRTTEDAMAALESGKTLRYDDEWYANIRLQSETKKTPALAVETIKCDCGHTVPRSQVMRASLGTACTDCYDRMSN